MPNDDKGRDDIIELRRHAKIIAQRENSQSSKELDFMSSEEIRQVLHELKVHQIELEMQNEELRQAQEDLGVVKERYFNLYNLAPVGYVSISEKGLVQEANLTAATLLGVTRAELIAMPFTRFILREDQGIFYLHRKQIFETNIPQAFEVRMVKKDKTAFWVGLHITMEYDSAGMPLHLVVLTDIIESKRTKAALRESEERFRAITDNASIVIFLKDTAGRYIHVNQHFEKILHVSNAAIKGKTDNEIFPRDMADVLVRNDQMVLQSGQSLEVEEKVPHDDGIHTYISVKFPLRNASGEINAVCGIATDITERKNIEEALQKAHDELERRILERTAALVSTNEKLSREIKEREQVEADLRESERKYRAVVETTGTGFVIISDQGKVLDANLEYVRQTGHTKLEEIAGKSVVEWTAAYEKDKNIVAIQQCMRDGYIRNLEIDYVNTSGSVIPIEINATVLRSDGVDRIFTISRDITERKRHEKEQIKMEKLESLGILAGGIAHDFNNILTGIMGNISFAKVYLNETHKSYEPLDEAEKATVRAGELAHQLLTFARGGEPIKKVVSPRHLIQEALSFILHGSNVKGAVDIPDSVHAIEADEGQISQVFQNIIINAAQAMPGGGILTVTARNEELFENNALSLPPGTYIYLSFADQGCGISEEDLKMIFDPYFTTKSAGVGLGLSSVHSIVNRHGGHIGVSSTVGKGTTFTIHLPSLGKAYTEYQEEVTVQVTGEHKGGSILVMDDDEMIREVALSMLTHLGCQVTICASGEEAVELYRNSVKSGAPFSLVIMDLTIPGGLGGKEAAEQILSFFPKARLAVSSGYSNDPIMSNYKAYGFIGAIAKPYSIDKLRDALHSFLVNG